jgi:uncharacterized repeat protein (TIGR01451 family)
MNPFKTLTLLVRLSLILLLSQSAQPAMAQEEADLSLKVTANRNKVKVGEEVTYTLTLTNLGPADVTSLFFSGSLPDTLNWVSFSCGAGTSYPTFCTLDSLASGATATAIVVATPLPYSGRQERIAEAYFSAHADYTPDPNSSNNGVHVPIKIIGKLPTAR